jgi:hypothetical protein
MNATAERFRAESLKQAWDRYAYECERARIEYERTVEFWENATVTPPSAWWGWHPTTEKERALPRWPR